VFQFFHKLFSIGFNKPMIKIKLTSVPTIHVVSVAYERFNEMKIFVQSWINQTEKNWKLTVIHDGNNPEFIRLMESYKAIDPDRIDFFCTDIRYNDYGHTLRDIGLKRLDSGYVLLTNADNYFIPKAVEFINQSLFGAVKMPDVIIFDMVHSHSHSNRGRKQPSYTYFNVDYKRCAIDISAAVVRCDLANAVGFRDKSHDGDATYFEDLKKEKEDLHIVKIPRVLFVHN